MSTAENPHAGQGMVVLDIGGDIGALVVTAPQAMAGQEIEICPAGARGDAPDEGGEWWDGDWHSDGHTHGDGHAHTHGPAWPHVSVLARPTPNGSEYAAVFPGLRTGEYDLWLRPDGPTRLSAQVSGGQITTTAWPR
ncbi:MAG: hypothetical protein ABI301_03455 [Jatrophihabitantaceae bacterium]